MTQERWCLLGFCLCTLVSCRPDDQRTETVDHEALRSALDVDVAARLDSGNAAFRADDLESALRHYQRVTELAPETAAGWFGVYLVEQARGNGEAAARALEQARAAAPGASLLQRSPEDTMR